MEDSLDDLYNELKWWERYVVDVSKIYDDEQTKKNLIEKANRRIAHIKKLIADRKASRGDRDKKEREAMRRKKARGLIPKKKK